MIICFSAVGFRFVLGFGFPGFRRSLFFGCVLSGSFPSWLLWSAGGAPFYIFIYARFLMVEFQIRYMRFVITRLSPNNNS